MSLFRELVRRNVFRVGVAYLAAAWVTVEAASLLFDTFEAPGWVVKVMIAVLAIGFPLTVIFSWAYEITPEGLKRTAEVDRESSITQATGKRLDGITIGLIIIAITVLALDRFDLVPGVNHEEAGTAVVTAMSVDAAADLAHSKFPSNSIAVLPFVNMSADPEQEYFSEGLAEELLNLLAKIPQLQVAARTSSFSFKGKDTTIAEVAETLRVANVLEGSVRRSGEKLRITAQLIRADNGYHLWSETWDRNLEDIFAIQDEIAGHVVEELRVKLLGETPQSRETDPDAYALVLQGRFFRGQMTPGSLENAEILFRQALEIDPDYAPAWAGLAATMRSRADRLLIPPEEGYPLVIQFAEKALELDPENASAYAILGTLAEYYKEDLPFAARMLQRALELAPGDAVIIGNAATLLGVLGRPDESLGLYEQVVSLDPVGSTGYHNLGLALIHARRLDEAASALRRAIALSPGTLSTYALLAEALLYGGEPEAALEIALQEPDETFRLLSLAAVNFGLGRIEESDAVLAEVIEKFEREAPYNIAQVYAYRGEKDLAFHWLDLAVEYEDPGLSELITNTAFSYIQDDPRWANLIESLGKSPEQLRLIRFEINLPQPH